MGSMDRVIFCVFLETDFKIYKQKLAEAFPLDDDDEDASEETEPLDPKARSSPSKKCKERFPDNSKDESDGDSGTDEKEPTEEKEREAGKEDREVKDGTEKELTEVNYGPEEKTDTEEMEGQSQGKEPSKDSIDIYEDAEFQSVDEHEQTEGHQGEDNMKHEMTALPDSQISFMDTEELSSICEEEAENEQLSRAGGMDDEGSSLEKGQTSCDHFEYIDADADINEDEDDAEMNIPLEIAVEAPESHPQEQLMEAHDEKTGN
ncbi:ADP-ribose glycohydrolase MACROD2-like [Ambystoma mexicanum]|uniref:ADP-ribose glycohydrolase MACROD2-like n=1 Tax=Ambystoma mexicanum TaxID=8296 RepID=UPI0037E7B52A